MAAELRSSSNWPAARDSNPEPADCRPQVEAIGLDQPCRTRPADAVPGRGGTGNAVRRPRPDGTATLLPPAARKPG
jgi:hypothetical protein